MNSDLQDNKAKQIPLKHNWSKLESQNKGFDDSDFDSLPAKTQSQKSQILFKKREAETILPDQGLQNTPQSDWKRDFVYRGMMKYFDREVKKAYNYILDNPGKDCYMVEVDTFRRAAEYGNPAGQYHLANCYLQGLGCEKSEEKAAEWHTKALLNGYKLSEDCLKEIIRHKSGEKCLLF